MSHIRGGMQGQVQSSGKGMVVGAVVYNPNNSQMAAPASAPLNHGAGTGMPSMMTGASNLDNKILNGTTTTLSNHEVLGSDDNSMLANTKEKTPMCLINELARYNKIQHQYTLVDEQGPAHKKIFYVKLKLDEEEYSDKGPSIKKAQHAAAEIALEKTMFKHPPPRPRKITPLNGGYGYSMYSGNPAAQHDTGESNEEMYADNENNITPTVRLNALAMKRCERPMYSPIEPQRPHYYPHANYDYRGMYNQRYHYPRVPKMFYVSLKMGQREFIGEGHSRQAARHNAAEKALKVLSNLPLPNQDMNKPVETPDSSSEETCPDDLKSEISLVHEIALKRKLHVEFKVINESGPPHMRSFVTECRVGDCAIVRGEGNGKKISKKRAAKAMLEELKKLAPLPTIINAKPKPKNPINKKKNRNLIKMQKACPDYGLGINPISRLIQIQQAKKEKDPVYSMVEERGQPRRREFVMQVQVGSHVAEGVGPNKKMAKRNAAESMLQLLGYSKPTPQPDKPALKSPNGTTTSGGDMSKKVTFVDQDCTTGRQLVPGVILMPGSETGLNRAPGGPLQMGDSSVSPRTTAVIAKELLDKGASPTAESLRKTGTRPAVHNVVQPKMQLLYLADVLGFQVQFTDFPKGNNKNEFLSLVSLSTSPPQVSHGAGITIEASHDAAALTALRSLAEMGIDSVTEGKVKKEMAAGDAPHQKRKEQLNSKKGLVGK